MHLYTNIVYAKNVSLSQRRINLTRSNTQYYTVLNYSLEQQFGLKSQKRNNRQ